MQKDTVDFTLTYTDSFLCKRNKPEIVDFIILEQTGDI